MSILPNIDVLREQSNKLDEEFDLEARLRRYKIEGLSFAIKEGLSNEDDAARALFVSDFIVTSSEVPVGYSDEDRHRSIIKTFINGIATRCDSSDKLMRIYFLAFKTAVLIRRQDLFMAGRGLERKTSLIRLKDAYLAPYLAVSEEILGSGSCEWEMSILSSALTKNFPHLEIEHYKGAPSHVKAQKMIPYEWNLLERYEKQKIIAKDDKVVLSNVAETSSVLFLDSGTPSLISKWNIPDSDLQPERDQEITSFLSKFFRELDTDQQLISYRGRISGTDERVFLVRDPDTKAKPLFLLRTPVSEINVSKTLSIIHLRGLEHDAWLEIDFTPIEVPDQDEIEVEVEVEVEIEVKEKDISEPVSRPKQEVSVAKSEQEKENGGFLSKLFSRFSGKKSVVDEKSVVMKTGKPVKKSKKKKVKKKVKKKMKKRRSILIQALPPLSHALTVDIVSDVDLFDIFDTFRESNYIITDVFDSDHETNKTTFFTDKKIGDSTTLTTLVEGLEERVNTVSRYFFKDIDLVIPEEVFFVSKAENRQVVCLASSEQRVIGIVAETFQKDVADWKWSKAKEEQLVQRRTLHMRAGQLLAARRHTKFDEAMERIIGSDVTMDDMKSIIIDKKIISGSS
ncbi:MAG: hypothetical protein ACXADA_22330 [Candidatus Hodarchaeales archaeon]